eukprot:354221-Pelagomonas_calceolata.AAC.1
MKVGTGLVIWREECTAWRRSWNIIFIIMRRMAEGVATVAHREVISACPKDLVAVTCETILVLATIKFRKGRRTFPWRPCTVMQGFLNVGRC